MTETPDFDWQVIRTPSPTWAILRGTREPMTETPAERPIEDVDLPVEDGEELAADRDADGVAEDRLSGVSYYDTVLLCYVGGVHPSKAAARKAEDYKGGRYVLRRV